MRNGTSVSAKECAKLSLSCACYNLRRASRVVTQLFDNHFDELGLKATQFTALAALARYEHERPRGRQQSEGVRRSSTGAARRTRTSRGAEEPNVLVAVAPRSSRGPTVGALAETLVLEQSSLSRNLAVLERQGLVRLMPGAEDRRERRVVLTRAGRGALARGFPMWRKAQAAISAALEAGELDNQLEWLRRLTEVAQQVRPSRSSGRAFRSRSPQTVP